MMPDIDGNQIARQLRADPATRDVLIVMFTARVQTDDKLDGFDAGADAYLTKPIQPRELIAQVKAVLKRRGLALAGGESTAHPPARQVLERGISIGLIAPKGGVGVSTVALNATIALHNANRQSVALADFRPGCGAIGAEVGLVNPQGLNRLLAFPPEEISPALIEAELVEHPSGIKLLPASSDPLDAQRIAEVDKFAAIAEQLPYLAYYTLFDLGAGLTPINVKVLSTCQQVLLVFEPIGQTVQQARLMFNYLVERGLPAERITPILVNRQRAGMQLSLGQTQDQFGRSIPIVFTAAPELAYQSQVSSTPMILRQPDGVTAQQFNSLALRMVQLAR
jgi:MinD-like ATPase involved in chromosome partitioning or flagellar assembly